MSPQVVQAPQAVGNPGRHGDRRRCGLTTLTLWLLFALATAREERRQAYENLETAVDAIHSAILDTDEQILAEQPGTHQIRILLLERGIPALQKLIARYRTEPGLRAELALLNHRAGEMYRLAELESKGQRSHQAAEGLGRMEFWTEKNRLEKADSHFTEALAIRRELVRAEGSPKNRADLAATLRSRGVLLGEMLGRAEEAIRSLEEAREILASLVGQQPGRKEWVYECAGALRELARLHKVTAEGRALAIEELKEAVNRLKPFEQEPDCVPHLARVKSHLAGLLADHGRKPEALDAYRESVRQYRRWLIHQIGKPEEARAYYRESLEHRRELSADNPRVPQFAHLHALTANGQGLLHMIWAGKSKEARELFDEALRVRETRLKGSSLPHHRNSLGHVYQNQAYLLRVEGKKREALALLDKVMTIRGEVLKGTPGHTLHRRHRAYNLGVRGEVLLELGDLAGAEAPLRTALAERQQLAAAGKDRKDFHDDVVLSRLALGKWHRLSGRPDKALEEFETAVVAARKLETDCPEYARHLAQALNERGASRAARGELVIALKDFDEAVKIGERICAQQPGLWEHQDVLGRSLYLLGVGQLKQKDIVKARGTLERARQKQAELRTLSPNQPDFASSLALTLTELGRLSLEKEPGEASRLLKEAAGLHKTATEAAREVPLYRDRLDEHLRLLQRHNTK
ncbi:MAG TPA: hypothetical protein VKD72_04870 [Gemmataceae bacterium]|nr:hypothetical protein [Gemmataceae bacterium]